MDDKTLEQYFTAIQEEFIKIHKHFDEQNKYFNERFNEQNVVLESIYEIIKEYDTERKKIKADIWDLQKAVAELQQAIKPKQQTV
ncbi:hypothetical protein KJ840_02095 [Patescibacteria group bacterium]|nr:hypothetical protein [Patescibacteria group bacterium]